MLDVGIVVQTKVNIGLVISTMFAVIACCLLVTPVFLATEAVAQRCSIKRGSPINSAKPTLSGKNLRQSLSSNNEETPPHVFSRGDSAKPSRTFPYHNTSGGCFRCNIYIKNDRTATWSGKKNDNIGT